MAFALPEGRSALRISFGMNARILESDRSPVLSYGEDGQDERISRWCDRKERDLRAAIRTEPAAQVMIGPLLLAKSVKFGCSVEEILDVRTVNHGGWRLELVPQKGESNAWGIWKATFRKDHDVRTTFVSDFSSAATWSSDGIEFSVFF